MRTTVYYVFGVEFLGASLLAMWFGLTEHGKQLSSAEGFSRSGLESFFLFLASRILASGS